MESVNWAAQMNTDSLFVMKGGPLLHWTCSLLILQFNFKSNYITFEIHFFMDPKKLSRDAFPFLSSRLSVS